MPAKSKWFLVLLRVFLFFLFSSITAVVFWLFSQPTLYIDMRSRDTAGMSQLFYKRTEGGAYSGDMVRNHPLVIGRQLLSFDLPSFYAPLRWDPPDMPGAYEVYSMWLQIGWSRWNIKLDALSAGWQVKNIEAFEDGVVIVTENDAFDPQVLVNLPGKQIAIWRVTVCCLTASVAMAVFWLLWACRFRFAEWNSAAERVISKAKAWIQQESPSLGEFGSYALTMLVLNLYSLSSFSISIDDEYAAFRSRPDIWVADGRWTTYLIERFVFPQPIMPYVPNFVFSLLIVLAYMFLIRAHNLKKDWRVYIAFPLFCTFPVWWFIAEFYANLPSVGLGTLLIAISIFIFSRTENERAGIYLNRVGLISLSLQAVLLAVAIGTYQSLIMLYITMGVGVILFKMLRNKSEEYILRAIAWDLLRLAITVGLGLIAYSIINNIAQYLIQREGIAYISGFWQLEKLMQSPLHVVETVLLEMRAFYTGTTGKYGDVIFGIGIVVISSGLSLLFQSPTRGFWFSVICMLLWLFLLVTPFLLNFVAGGVMPTRAMLPIAYVVWVLAVILINRVQGSTVLIGASLVIILVLQVQILRTNGMYAAASFIAQEHDRMLAADIYRRIAETDPEFSRYRYVRVDIYGTKNVETAYGSPWSSTMGASFFDWDSGNPGRMLNFMRLMGYQKIALLADEQRLEMTPIFETMPAWPAPGSVQKFDDVILIKLSDKPDAVHALYSPE
jgi:hypothetical protein